MGYEDGGSYQYPNGLGFFLQVFEVHLGMLWLAICAFPGYWLISLRSFWGAFGAQLLFAIGAGFVAWGNPFLMHLSWVMETSMKTHEWQAKLLTFAINPQTRKTLSCLFLLYVQQLVDLLLQNLLRHTSFPVHIRVVAMGISYNISAALFGGPTPYICSQLLVHLGAVTRPFRSSKYENCLFFFDAARNSSPQW